MYEPARANEAIHYIIYIARGFSIYICRIDINVIPKWRQKRT